MFGYNNQNTAHYTLIGMDYPLYAQKISFFRIQRMHARRNLHTGLEMELRRIMKKVKKI